MNGKLPATAGAEETRLPNPALLMQIGLAYRSSAVLFAAIDVDVFSALAAGPKTALELAAGSGTHHPSLRLLLDACVTEGLLTVDADRYANTPVADAFLVRGRPAYSANGFKYAENLYSAWGRLADRVRTGRPPMPAEIMLGEDKEQTRAFVLSMHERARGIGSVLSHFVNLDGRKRLLDVGGGPGTYSVALVQQTRGLRATVLDVPGVLEVTKELVQASGFADRVDLMPGDYLRSPFGTGYDVALLSGMMHRESPESCRLLLRKTFDALDPGGLIIVSDVFFDDDHKRSPPFAVYFALNMMLTSADGAAHAVTEMAAWMREAGFINVEPNALPKPNPHTLLLGTRP
jgi:cyclopropane fatty-acyl-phospholipid synthase-like methyltransferase